MGLITVIMYSGAFGMDDGDNKYPPYCYTVVQTTMQPQPSNQTLDRSEYPGQVRNNSFYEIYVISSLKKSQDSITNKPGLSDSTEIKHKRNEGTVYPKVSSLAPVPSIPSTSINNSYNYKNSSLVSSTELFAD